MWLRVEMLLGGVHTNILLLKKNRRGVVVRGQKEIKSLVWWCRRVAVAGVAAVGSRLQKTRKLSVDRLRRIRTYLLPFTRDNHACEHYRSLYNLWKSSAKAT